MDGWSEERYMDELVKCWDGNSDHGDLRNRTELNIRKRLREGSSIGLPRH